MDFGLSEAQELLRSSVAQLLGEAAPVEQVRAVMESEDGCDRALLGRLGEQGLAGILIPETHDGSALGLLDASVVAQELGRAAAPLSFHSSSALAPLLIAAVGSAERQAELLPPIASGRHLAGVAVAEDQTGASAFAADALVADSMLWVQGGRVWWLDRYHPGLEVSARYTIDETRRVGVVSLADGALDGVEPLGSLSAESWRSIEAAGWILMAADCLGACQQALRIAVEYSLQRRQFGRIVGSFQAVKHLCAEMAAEIDPIQSLLWYTAYCWDENRPEWPWLAPLLKAHASEVGAEVASKATQVFGGIGFTWECDMHLWYKRIHYDRAVMGSASELRRIAMERQLA